MLVGLVLLALGLFLLFRYLIQSVSKGQTEAGRALSMSEGWIMRKVILPQALRIVLPPMVNN